MGLLKFIFFALLFYYGFKFLARLFAPFLIKKVADTMQKKAEQQFGGQQPKNNVKEGETIIDKAPNRLILDLFILLKFYQPKKVQFFKLSI